MAEDEDEDDSTDDLPLSQTICDKKACSSLAKDDDAQTSEDEDKDEDEEEDSDDDVPLSTVVNAKATVTPEEAPAPSAKDDSEDDTPLSGILAAQTARASKDSDSEDDAPLGIVRAVTPPRKRTGGSQAVAVKRRRSDSSSSSSSTSASSSDNQPILSKTRFKFKVKPKRKVFQLTKGSMGWVKAGSGAADTKQVAVAQLLCRWWYALPDWPPQDDEFYLTELKKRNLRRVHPSEWEWVPELDKKGRRKVYELRQFRGTFRNSEGEFIDLRPRDTCPCYTNMMKKSLSELYALIVKAYEGQIEDLKKSVYDERLLQEKLKAQLNEYRLKLQETQS